MTGGGVAQPKPGRAPKWASMKASELPYTVSFAATITHDLGIKKVKAEEEELAVKLSKGAKSATVCQSPFVSC